MEISTTIMNMSDDEEDLELLRIAALQTLKKPTISKICQQQPLPPKYNKIRRSPQTNRGRVHYSGPGRGGRCSQYNGRIRSLISIQTIQSDEQPFDKNIPKYAANAAPKLILPQDRYCNKNQDQIKCKEVSSKFSRYDNSDKSESEEESESEHSDSEDAVKLERSSSLEVLMQELEYEISGEKPKEADKLKAKKRKNKHQLSENVEEEIVEEQKTLVVEQLPNEQPSSQIAPTTIPEPPSEMQAKHQVKLPMRRKRSPLNGSRRQHKHFQHPHRNGFSTNFTEPPPNFPYMYPTNIPYMPPQPYPPPQLPSVPPNYLMHRPLSPLNLNTEVLSTITMAPLSPRSAAFVLQNREIIERRKKSPHRSYSRSPSPRFRRSKSPRSLTPRRSLSPRRYHRSASPKRISPPRRPARNSPPRKTSPLRPVKISSPEVKVSPKSRRPSPKSSIKERLGARSLKTDDVMKSPEVNNTSKPEPIEQVVDPVLEARKRKFEDKPVVTVKEGIIKLKIKPEILEDTKEENEEGKVEDSTDDLLDLDITETLVDTLFSDEESDHENEGRFKLSNSNVRSTATSLPFTLLLNGVDRDIKNKALADNYKDKHNRRDRDRYTRDRRRDETRRKRAATPPPRHNLTVKVRKSEDETVSVKHRILLKTERKSEQDTTGAMENKKVDSKNKIHSTQNGGAEKHENKKKENNGRKVAIAKEAKENDNDRVQHDAEVIVDEEEEIDIARKTEAGDLRAQLSRKRAERQHKLPVAEDVQSRLLQNALQGAVFKKNRKSKKKEKTREAAPKDKIPIRMRLGLSNESDIFTETKRRKKKSRSSEQV